MELIEWLIRKINNLGITYYVKKQIQIIDWCLIRVINWLSSMFK